MLQRVFVDVLWFVYIIGIVTMPLELLITDERVLVLRSTRRRSKYPLLVSYTTRDNWNTLCIINKTPVTSVIALFHSVVLSVTGSKNQY